MNATGIAPKSNTDRLKRIKKVSRILKYSAVLYFFVPLVLIAIFNHSYGSTENIPNVMFVLGGAGFLAFLLGAGSFIRLMSCYERGVFFGAANISEFKNLSRCLLGYGLANVVANVVYAGGILLPDGLACPWIVVGGAVYVVAWIMDEGRKIQEEQELTV